MFIVIKFFYSLFLNPLSLGEAADPEPKQPEQPNVSFWTEHELKQKSQISIQNIYKKKIDPNDVSHRGTPKIYIISQKQRHMSQVMVLRNCGCFGIRK